LLLATLDRARLRAGARPAAAYVFGAVILAITVNLLAPLLGS
jgi:hypothetical protein